MPLVCPKIGSSKAVVMALTSLLIAAPVSLSLAVRFILESKIRIRPRSLSVGLISTLNEASIGWGDFGRLEIFQITSLVAALKNKSPRSWFSLSDQLTVLG